MKYQVGGLQYYEEDDPLFDTLEDAIKHAVRESYNDSPHGVWSDQASGSELLVIVYMQEEFHRHRGFDENKETER